MQAHMHAHKHIHTHKTITTAAYGSCPMSTIHAHKHVTTAPSADSYSNTWGTSMPMPSRTVGMTSRPADATADTMSHHRRHRRPAANQTPGAGGDGRSLHSGGNGAHTHTCTHTLTHVQSHAHTLARALTLTLPHTPTRTHPHPHTHTQARMHVCIHTLASSHTSTAHKHASIHTHAPTHACLHEHKHIYMVVF